MVKNHMHVMESASRSISLLLQRNVDKFLAAFKTCFDAVTAEPECIFFEVFHDIKISGHLQFVESLSKSKEWFINVKFRRETLDQSKTVSSRVI